jgi:hypothetical protein
VAQIATQGASCVVLLKWSAEVPEIADVNGMPRLERCPYDGSPVVADAYPGGFLVVSCESCGAAWELHNAFVRRVTEPDWIAVRLASERRHDGSRTIRPRV